MDMKENVIASLRTTFHSFKGLEGNWIKEIIIQVGLKLCRVLVNLEVWQNVNYILLATPQSYLHQFTDN